MIYRVSVALPVYNGARYLIPQLDSILEQLQPQDELVAAYQDSSDASLEILKEYQRRDARVKIFVNPERGITSNFNLAIRECSGDYIFLSDQDDVWLPGKRERCVEALCASGAQLVIHNAVHTDAELHPRKETFFEIYPIGPGKWKNIKKPRMSGCCTTVPEPPFGSWIWVPGSTGLFGKTETAPSPCGVSTLTVGFWNVTQKAAHCFFLLRTEVF